MTTSIELEPSCVGVTQTLQVLRAQEPRPTAFPAHVQRKQVCAGPAPLTCARNPAPARGSEKAAQACTPLYGAILVTRPDWPVAGDDTLGRRGAEPRSGGGALPPGLGTVEDVSVFRRGSRSL